MAIDDWDEIRTAFHVARLGTVSGAAEVLGVHHATVIRHVDALEARLGTKLFQRHARGYTATEAGQDLLQVAQTTQDQFGQLVGRIKGRGNSVAGDLMVTSLQAISPILTPVLVEFQRAHPELTVRFLTGDRLFRLEYGEAHVAIRAGNAPQEPDNVVQPFVRLQVGLYVHEKYVDEFGMPSEEDGFAGHRFVSLDDADTRAPFHAWTWANIPKEQIVFRTASNLTAQDAVLAGAGVGFLTRNLAEDSGKMIEVIPPREEWEAPTWLVTHVDLHRTAKVQTFLTFLKEKAKDWTGVI